MPDLSSRTQLTWVTYPHIDKPPSISYNYIMRKLPNTPPRGTVDWFPEDFQIRKTIFDTWRTVCTQFGYEEYLSPLVENADIYRAKSGEDVGGTELITIKKDDGELAIRPEMTPSITRMITRIYPSAPKPIRYFSIANFMRFQKPQRGRNREFWQLNYDIFGVSSVQADTEIIQIALEIFLSFKPPEGAFTVFINSRKLIDTILDTVLHGDMTKRTAVVHIMDKWEKLSPSELRERLANEGLKNTQQESLFRFMESTDKETLLNHFPDLADNDGYRELEQILTSLAELGYVDWVRFQPNVIRGFDYYDGMVFEVFDNHPENNRAMCGGGRYNGLAGIFGKESFPAVGCAPGDETTKLFLESWGLLDTITGKKEKRPIYIPLLDEAFTIDVQTLAQTIRSTGVPVQTDVEVRDIKKALSFANKKNTSLILLLGTKEKETGTITLKNMQTGEQSTVDRSKILDFLPSSI